MTWVTVDNRRFIVEYADDGSPVRIKERKKKNPGHPYLEMLYNAPYWHADHNPVGKSWTMVSRILAAAEAERKEP